MKILLKRRTFFFLNCKKKLNAKTKRLGPGIIVFTPFDVAFKAKPNGAKYKSKMLTFDKPISSKVSSVYRNYLLFHK